MYWYLKCLKQYADFNGRARRKEYWMFALFNFIFIFITSILDFIIGLNNLIFVGIGPFYFLYTIAVIVPGLAVGIRRLHDVGKSGWYILLALIPIIGWIWVFVLFVTDSQEGENEYGPDPKEFID